MNSFNCFAKTANVFTAAQYLDKTDILAFLHSNNIPIF
jgi:hypothetical protein